MLDQVFYVLSCSCWYHVWGVTKENFTTSLLSELRILVLSFCFWGNVLITQPPWDLHYELVSEERHWGIAHAISKSIQEFFAHWEQSWKASELTKRLWASTLTLLKSFVRQTLWSAKELTGPKCKASACELCHKQWQISCIVQRNIYMVYKLWY